MIPGTTVRPPRSTIFVRGPGCASPTERKRPSLIASVDTMRFWASIVCILPCWRITSASVCPGGVCWSVGLAARARGMATVAPVAAAVWMNCRRVMPRPFVVLRDIGYSSLRGSAPRGARDLDRLRVGAYVVRVLGQHPACGNQLHQAFVQRADVAALVLVQLAQRLLVVGDSPSGD